MASAVVSSHVPLFAFDPEEAAASQSEGRFSVARTVPASAVATFAGTVPERIFRTAEVPIAVSSASRRAFYEAVENWRVMAGSSFQVVGLT